MLGAFTVMDLSGIFNADAQARVVMGMGTVDEQMACRAQRAFMRRLTHRFSSRGDRDYKPSGPGGQPASFVSRWSARLVFGQLLVLVSVLIFGVHPTPCRPL